MSPAREMCATPSLSAVTMVAVRPGSSSGSAGDVAVLRLECTGSPHGGDRCWTLPPSFHAIVTLFACRNQRRTTRFHRTISSREHRRRSTAVDETQLAAPGWGREVGFGGNLDCLERLEHAEPRSAPVGRASPDLATLGSKCQLSSPSSPRSCRRGGGSRSGFQSVHRIWLRPPI